MSAWAVDAASAVAQFGEGALRDVVSRGARHHSVAVPHVKSGSQRRWRRGRGRRHLGRQLGRICCGPDARLIQRSRPPPVRVVVAAVQVGTGGADRTDQVVHAGWHRALIISRLAEGQTSRMAAELDVGLAGAGARLFHECDLLCKALIVVGVFAKTKAVRLLTGWHKSRRLQASSGSARRWRWTRIVSLHNPGG